MVWVVAIEHFIINIFAQKLILLPINERDTQCNIMNASCRLLLEPDGYYPSVVSVLATLCANFVMFIFVLSFCQL